MFYKLRQSTWTKRVALIVVAALAMTLMAACGKSAKEPSLEFKGVQDGAVIATYKGGTVTDLEFDKFKGIFVLMQPETAALIDLFQEMLMDQYIGYKLLSAKASDADLKKAKEATKAQLDSYKEYIKADANAAALAQEKGITEQDMETFLYMTSAINANAESQITDDDVKAEYEEHKPDYTVSDVRHILVSLEVTDPATGEVTLTRTEEEALARAKEAKEKLAAGGDWNEIAKDYSDDPGSNANGGLYENYPGGNWVEEFKQAAFEQPINEIGEPVLTAYGYHVIEVVKRDIKDYADIEEDLTSYIRSLLINRHVEAFMTEELQTYEIEVNFPQPEETETPEGSEETPADGETEQPADEAADGDKAAE